MTKVNTKIKSTRYYNIGQLRIEYWNNLKNSTSILSRMSSDTKGLEKQIENVENLLQDLYGVERFFAFPGLYRLKEYQNALMLKEYNSLARQVADTARQLVSDSYRSQPDLWHDDLSSDDIEDRDQHESQIKHDFEVLFVEAMNTEEEKLFKSKLRDVRGNNEKFSYDYIIQKSFQEALIALQFNHNIQAVVIRYAPPFQAKKVPEVIKPYVDNILDMDIGPHSEEDLGPVLGRWIKRFRPELDAYYVTDTSLGELKDSTLKSFRRIFYRKEDVQELHLSILRGVSERYETPFFSALREYSRKPTGIFHAMPISRGNSVFKSRWIKDFGDFYGRNMFLAETSATTGGLDSLLQPTGPLKKAQQKAGDAYGSQQTFFVTNGTSTANKIVLQSLITPEDIVLIDRDCHKSHHYGLVLSGGFPVYLDSYPIEKYSMYGAVPLQQIKDKLLRLKEAGKLEKVKMLLLTNCTFDGMVYNVEKVMQEILAIKPDMIFLWDEAWFAFAGFNYIYKQRTGMYVAKKLHQKYQSRVYREEYNHHLQNLKKGEDPTLPDPDRVRIRVYSTQSTHKTLSSFRQGSMIHIWDEDFRRKAENTFMEDYMTHTSTSPNYQMLASLDVGRRQVQFEGSELVERSIEMAMILRARINDNPQLNKYFDVLTVHDFIPDVYRQTSLKEYYDPETGWNRIEDSWLKDEFALDPTKITLHIGRTGLDGDTFKNRYLMDKFNIQINKTSRNTVLFLTNIGTTNGSVTYLTNALLKIADELDNQVAALNEKEKNIHEKRIHSLTVEVPPLPDFSHFHAFFQPTPGLPGGDIRSAFFMAYNENNYEYIPLSECLPLMREGRDLVASSFVIPYPPGFPVLVPGQVVSEEIIQFLLALDVSEIHGYRADLGLRVFTEEILQTREPKKKIDSRRTRKTKNSKTSVNA